MAMLNNQMVDPFSVQLEFAAGYPVIPHMFEKTLADLPPPPLAPAGSQGLASYPPPSVTWTDRESTNAKLLHVWHGYIIHI